MTDILTVSHLTKEFGRVKAVNDLSFQVGRGALLGLVGPNGAGKTTLFDLLAGCSKPDRGSIALDREDISGQSPSARSRLGIGRTYQVPRPFPRLTVYENVLVPVTHGGGLSQREGRSKAEGLLEQTGLSGRKNDFPSALNSLERKMLELARALGASPRLLLLDEIAGGVTDAELQQVLRIVRQLHETGITIIWVEHIPRMMVHGVERLLVLSNGRMLASGNPRDVMAAREVVDVYLGLVP
ncbi:MAG: ATP-binding cassette domain-containing protein [Desulfomonile tiedjei]|nr:ATP-binding cassette domain-containing protein [Desulfomonile tiedjei]